MTIKINFAFEKLMNDCSEISMKNIAQLSTLNLQLHSCMLLTSFEWNKMFSKKGRLNIFLYKYKTFQNKL